MTPWSAYVVIFKPYRVKTVRRKPSIRLECQNCFHCFRERTKIFHFSTSVGTRFHGVDLFLSLCEESLASHAVLCKESLQQIRGQIFIPVACEQV